MPLLRTKEIRGMDAEAIAKKLLELRDELMHERGVAAMGGAPPNPGKIRALRKNIARILTILSEERRLGTAPAPAPKETEKEGTSRTFGSTSSSGSRSRSSRRRSPARSTFADASSMRRGTPSYSTSVATRNGFRRKGAASASKSRAVSRSTGRTSDFGRKTA